MIIFFQVVVHSEILLITILIWNCRINNGRGLNLGLKLERFIFYLIPLFSEVIFAPDKLRENAMIGLILVVLLFFPLRPQQVNVGTAGLL